jgi:carbon storage regulator
LKLSRRRDQSVIIDGGSIILTVVDIRGDKVRLGIHAPGILIHRQEVVFTILDEDANAFG